MFGGCHPTFTPNIHSFTQKKDSFIKKSDKVMFCESYFSKVPVTVSDDSDFLLKPPPNKIDE
ncbi:17602_t:CDS:2 [Funneliformis geosporum]|uniref:17602_t:CDS:1 n=1 Tax=Funneliformis geosporum TaxID=1117311 RepID=A0A9W4WKF3_9GLOM|nr:17602_t:CDS:2 [Funneliformis geosporum]